jgi:AraC family transcriptional regulator
MDPNAGSPTPIALAAPRLVEGRSMRLACLGGTFTPATMRGIVELWNRFGGMLRRDEIPGRVGIADWGLGFHCFDGSPSFEYLCATEVAEDAAPPGLRIVEVPALRWAVFAHAEHVSRLGEAIEAIHQRWMPGSGMAADRRPGAPDFLERYGEEFDPETGFGGLEVWYPVRQS